MVPKEPDHGVLDVEEQQLSLAFDTNLLGSRRVLKAYYLLLLTGCAAKVVMDSPTVGSLEEKYIPIVVLHPG